VRKEDALSAGLRAFERATGHSFPNEGAESLGSAHLRGDRVLVVWAIDGDFEPQNSEDGAGGRGLERLDWFSLDEARRRIKPRQREFLERLRSVLPKAHDSQRSIAGARPSLTRR
jgi:predicted NUDIX family NTP pyrophosphohydrolase